LEGHGYSCTEKGDQLGAHFDYFLQSAKGPALSCFMSEVMMFCEESGGGS
jgi:hypothetical protein